MLALWGPFSPGLCTLVPLSHSQGAVCQDPEGRWKMGPAIPSRSSRSCLCPPSSHSPQWVLLAIYECPQAVNAGRRLSPTCSVPEPLHLLCLLPGCFPRESQGSCVSLSKTAAPLAFFLERTSWPISAFSVVPLRHGAEYCLLS